MDLKGILNSLKDGIMSAMQYAAETVFTFARAMVQIKQFVLIIEIIIIIIIIIITLIVTS